MEGLIGIKAKKKTIIITAIIVVLIVVFGGMAAYQVNHFNQGIAINGVDVSGLTAKQAVDKLENTKLNNDVWVDGKVIFHGEATSSGFKASDVPAVKKLLKKQFTLIPLHKDKNYNILADNDNQYRKTTVHSAVEQILNKENQSRKSAKDAYAELKDGKVTIVKAEDGNRYDVKAMMSEFDKQINNDKIELKSVEQKPLTASSKTVQDEKAKLEKLADASVNYRVENQTYDLKASDCINSAKYINGKYIINSEKLKDKINQINKEKATLGKKFKFKTTAGKEIEVQGKTYGWALSDKKAQATILRAMEDGTKNVDAKQDIYGIGYNENGTGYGVTSNDGIGDTYAELSLADQHAWFYRDGKLVDQVDVVTGDVKTNSETPKGVYYIMYQQSPSILRGTHPDGKKYACKVQYWSQFTDDGCGFHDASWRTNWAKNAYLTDGSNGCANIRPAQAEAVYKALSVNEPVIIY